MSAMTRIRSRLGRQISRDGALVLAAALSLAGLGVPTAFGSASLSVQPIVGDQLVGRTTTVVVTSTSDGTGARVGVRFRPASGPLCGGTFLGDAGESAGQQVFLDRGPWTFSFPITWTASGRMRICIWADGIDDGPAFAATSLEFSVVDPPGSVAISSPRRGTLGRVVHLELTGQAPTPRYLFAKVRPFGGQACAGTFADDPGGAILSSPFPTQGGYAARTSFVPSTRSTYIVCSWLTTTADSRGDPTGSVAQQAIPVTGPLSNLHDKPEITKLRISGRTVRFTARTFKPGTLTVRLIGTNRDLLVTRRASTAAARAFPIVYRGSRSLPKGRYLIEARFTALGRPGASRPARAVVVLR